MTPHDQPTPHTAGAAALSPEALLEHLDWVQRLAGRLARDESRADDLVQRTFLRALRRPPHAEHSAQRAWLARVLRNEARMVWRSDERRREREERVAHERGAESPSALEVEQRFELQRHLVAAVNDLDEPYRTTVVLRHFEDLQPREISKRLGVPVKTVETRLARARAQLRLALDSKHGSRAAWAGLALPSLRASAPTAVPLVAGALLMALKWIAGAVVVSLLLVLGLKLGAGPAIDRADVDSVQRQDVAVATEDPQGPLTEDTPTTRTMALGPAAEPSATPTDAPGAVVKFSGVVFGADGEPEPGVPLRLDPAPTDAKAFASRSDGRFEVEVPLDQIALDGRPSDGLRYTLQIIADSSAWTTLIAAEVQTGVLRSITGELGITKLVVAVAPARELRGRVVTLAGDAIEGAALELTLLKRFRARFDALLDDTRDRRWQARSSDDGTFVIAAAPTMAGSVLTASAPGYSPQTIDPVPLDDRDVIVTLERLDRSLRVDGIVVDAQGHPIKGARVGLGHALRRTDDTGQFWFQLDADDGVQNGPRRILAVAKGFCPVTFEPVVGGVDGPEWPDFIELRFTREPATIAGRVLDEAGLPVIGAKVWATDSTVIGTTASGDALPAEILLRDDGLLWYFVETDATGRFELDGLLERTYSLRALWPGTVRMTPEFAVPADTENAELRFESEELIHLLRGRVVDRHGIPVSGASVNVTRESLCVGTDRRMMLANARSSAVKTDEEGRFEQATVPRQIGVLVHTFARGFTTSQIEITTIDGDELEIVLSRDCHVRVIVNDPALGIDSVHFVDADGALIMFFQHGSGIVQYMRSTGVVGGRTQTLVVPDTAVTVVFMAGTERVTTVPIELTGEGVTVVSP